MARDFGRSDDELRVLARIRAWLKVRGMNLRDLATATQIPYDTVQAYLSGKRGMPAQTLAAFSRALGISADHILFGRPMLDREALLSSVKFVDDVRRLSSAFTDTEVAANMLMECYMREFGRQLGEAGAIAGYPGAATADRGVWFAYPSAERQADTSAGEVPDTSDTSPTKAPSKPFASG
ncbi:helix-turn-helix domain-containing protein [Elioraea sp.]|uniref:helix-turn-helix domain-containing protein n=1 Tax=Elioraea sp. TaxID=2185103 RepID=UPI003F72CDF6